MEIKTFVRFENGSEDLLEVTAGPFDCVQLTYDILRAWNEVGPDDGDEIAHFDGDHWRLKGNPQQQYTDVIIFGDQCDG